MVTHEKRQKNKTVATWLALCTGILGGHRFYLYGLTDTIAWILPIPTVLGLYGLYRLQTLGLDDKLSWVLVPILGLCIAIAMLTTLIYGLMESKKWNQKFYQPEDSKAGYTNWFIVVGLVIALMFGTIALMSSVVLAFQYYFEYQVEQGRQLAQ
jgi:TM2 domain-containing membrane protein YozV